MRKSYQLSAISFQLLFAVASALLLILSFPQFNIWICAWVAFVPMLFAIENQKPLKAFLIAYLAGFLFFLGTVYWLVHVSLPGMLMVVAYLALYFGFFGLILSFISAPACTNDFFTFRPGLYLRFLFMIPAAWVALEWIRAHALTGFGWNILGYSQSFNLPVIQIADMTGAYGVSFLVMVSSAAIFLTIKGFKRSKEFYIPLGMAAILVFIISGYGIFRLNNVFTGEKLKVAVIQGNIPQDQKWDRRFTDSILAKYEDLSRKAAIDKPDLIIWPETSVPGFLEGEKDLLERVKGIVTDVKTPLLAGAPRYEDTKKGTLYYNSSYLFLKDGSIAGRYDKIHLVPFGEYLPLKDALSFVRKFARQPIGDFTAGKNYTVFRFTIRHAAKYKNESWQLIKKVGFSSLICFEDIFPDLAREFVKRNTGFLVNITNDAWFGRSSAAYQHAQASVFRAVENRINVLRAANTGLSCFIDQKGRITSRVMDGGRDLFTDGFKIHEIILSRARTVYTVYGDVFAYVCIFFTVLGILHSFRLRINDKKRLPHETGG